MPSHPALARVFYSLPTCSRTNARLECQRLKEGGLLPSCLICEVVHPERQIRRVRWPQQVRDTQAGLGVVDGKDFRPEGSPALPPPRSPLFFPCKIMNPDGTSISPTLAMMFRMCTGGRKYRGRACTVSPWSQLFEASMRRCFVAGSTPCHSGSTTGSSSSGRRLMEGWGIPGSSNSRRPCINCTATRSRRTIWPRYEKHCAWREKGWRTDELELL